MQCELPAGHTARALKKALPERSVVSKDARATVNSAASMFALYLSSIAQDNAAASKRQTVGLKDVLQALRDADFEHFVAPVEECLRESKAVAALKKNKRGGAKNAVRGDALDADAAAAGGHDDDDGDEDEGEGEEDDDDMQSAVDAATDEDDENGVDAAEEEKDETNADERMLEADDDDDDM